MSIDSVRADEVPVTVGGLVQGLDEGTGTGGTDLNLVVLRGRVAADSELRVFDSGSRLIRVLLTLRSDTPRRRVDVVPVTIWDPSEGIWSDAPLKGDRGHIVGGVQRRFWEGADGRRSRVEVVAESWRFSREIAGGIGSWQEIGL